MYFGLAEAVFVSLNPILAVFMLESSAPSAHLTG